MLEKCESDIQKFEDEIKSIQDYNSTIKKRKAEMKDSVEIIEEIIKEGAISDANLRLLVDKIIIFEKGKKLKIKDVATQIQNGFALVPEDRQSQGLIQTLDIGKNTSISSLKDYVKGLFLDEKAENAAVDEQIRDIHIKVADKRLPILSLSGGNQQKVVIGKGLLTKPKILLLDEPSRGIDIGAKTEVFEIIHELAEKGLSIIVISSELKEIMAIADRICVLSNGKKTGELTGDEITEDTLVRTSYAGLGTGRNA